MRILSVSGILFGILTILISGCAHTEMKDPVHPEPVYIEPTEEEVLIAIDCTEATNHLFIYMGVSSCSELHLQSAQIEEVSRSGRKTAYFHKRVNRVE